jgi:hypothetical protein
MAESILLQVAHRVPKVLQAQSHDHIAEDSIFAIRSLDKSFLRIFSMLEASFFPQ